MEFGRDTDSNVSNGSEGDVGLVEDGPSLYRMPWGIIIKERIVEIMLRYGVPLEFVCKLWMIMSVFPVPVL